MCTHRGPVTSERQFRLYLCRGPDPAPPGCERGHTQGQHQVCRQDRRVAVDGIRRLMCGGPVAPVAGDAAVLAAYLMLALGVSTFAARRGRVWTPAQVKPELAL